MLLTARLVVFAAVPALYFLIGWLHWNLGIRLVLLGATALLSVSAWTTRTGYETTAGKTLVLLTGACFFAMLGFHAFLRDFFGVQPDDSGVMAALFGSDRSEVAEFVEQHVRPLTKHILILLLTLAIFGGLVWWRPSAKERFDGSPKRPNAWRLALASSVVFILLHLHPTLRNQNPALYLPMRYSAWKQQVESLRQLRVAMAVAGTDPGLVSMRSADDQPRTIVFILGESITRLNLPAYGYSRKTTPELESLGEQLTWFPDVLSSDPSTAPALEKMLTPATIAQPDLWLTKPDVLLIAKQAGYKTFWLSNHSTDAHGQISVFASRAEKTVLTNKGGSRGEGSYDEVVLPYLEMALDDPAPRKFIIVHLLNAHPAYFYRYPPSFARFNDSDDSVTRYLQAAGRKFWAIRLRNYYDNAILYTDHVLKRSLDLCRDSEQRLAWIFVPDHGQDAAHTTSFAGHNAKAPSQYEIPMIFWHSSTFPRPEVDADALRARRYQTDVFDHTLIGLLGVSGDYYDPQRDLFSPEFEEVPRTIAGRPYP